MWPQRSGPTHPIRSHGWWMGGRPACLAGLWALPPAAHCGHPGRGGLSCDERGRPTTSRPLQYTGGQLGAIVACAAHIPFVACYSRLVAVECQVHCALGCVLGS